MAELHIIGHITGARHFDDRSLFCKWSLESGPTWRVLEGLSEGQTHLDTPTVSGEHKWSHPIDVHYMTVGLQGWPKFEFQVWGVNWLSKANLSAYGFLNVPTQPGRHILQCSTWRPVGSLRERVVCAMTGYRMHLIDHKNIVSNGLSRHSIQAQSMGNVEIDINIIMKDFEKYGVDIHNNITVPNGSMW